MSDLNSKQSKLLDELLPKFKSYKTQTKRQADLISLAEKTSRNDDEVKRLKALLDIEQKAIDLANAQKELSKLAKAEKDKERAKFDNGTYQLGGLFRAMLKENNPAFVSAFRHAVQSEKIKTTYTDNTPLYAEYDKFLAPAVSVAGLNIQGGANTPPHS